MSATILNATLVEIDPRDGGQKWVTDAKDHRSVIFLCGRDKASNCHVGMTGILEYRSNASRGGYYALVRQCP